MAFVLQIETKGIDEPIIDEHWCLVMQEELNEFERNNIWEFVPKASST